MPTVGYGTAGLGDFTVDGVYAAIRAGYRLIDSAEVGWAILEEMPPAAVRLQTNKHCIESVACWAAGLAAQPCLRLPNLAPLLTLFLLLSVCLQSVQWYDQELAGHGWTRRWAWAWLSLLCCAGTAGLRQPWSAWALAGLANVRP